MHNVLYLLFRYFPSLSPPLFKKFLNRLHLPRYIVPDIQQLKYLQ